VPVSDVAQQVWEGVWLEGELSIQWADEGDQTQEEAGKPTERDHIVIGRKQIMCGTLKNTAMCYSICIV